MRHLTYTFIALCSILAFSFAFSASAAAASNRVVFTAPAGTNLADLQSDLTRKGWRIVDVIAPLNKIVADAPAGPRVPGSDPSAPGVRMNRDMQVHLIEPKTPRQAAFEVLSSHLRIRDEMLWGEGFTGLGVKVAVIDTGVADIPKLAGRVEHPEGTAYDINGHGTHVAGIVAAAQAEGMVGVAPQATILSYPALESDGSGSGAKVSAAIVSAVNQGAQVINLSLGGPERDTSIKDAIAWAHSQGAVVVCASGNSGKTEVFWPAAEPGCLGVGAVDDYGRKTIFSTSGPHVDIAAPGQDIASLDTAGSEIAMSGTSMAAPHVSGALALLISSGMTAHQAQEALLAHARDVGNTGADIWTGQGILDVYGALHAERQRPLLGSAPVVRSQILAGQNPMLNCGTRMQNACVIRGRKGQSLRTRLRLTLVNAPWQQDKFVIRVDRRVDTRWRLYADGDLAIASPSVAQPAASGLLTYWHSGLYRVQVYSQGVGPYPRTALKTLWVKRA